MMENYSGLWWKSIQVYEEKVSRFKVEKYPGLCWKSIQVSDKKYPGLRWKSIQVMEKYPVL